MGKYTKKRSRAQKEEAELEQSYHSISASKKNKRKASGSNRKGVVITCFIALIAVGIAIFAGYVYFDRASLDGIILENVTVAGVDVGGLTQLEAIEAVSAATADTYSQKPMTVKVLDSSTELPAGFCGTLDVRLAVRDAYRFGNTGPESKRQSEQQTAMTDGYAVDITPYLDLDTESIKSALADLGKNYSSTLSQTTYEVTGTAPQQMLVIHLGVPEYGLNLNALYDTVMDAYNQNVFEAVGACEILEPDPIDLDAIYQQYYVAPVDATFDPDTFEVNAGTDGYGFDLDSAKELINQAEFGATIEIPFVSIPPSVTGEKLKEQLFSDELATYTASSSSSSNRDTNLRLACEAINGVVLYPGDVFSYNDTLGERTADRGYKPAASYVGNKTVDTLGGGICQVSSALYYCAMVADLDILLRVNHTFANSYVPLGMDATVNWGTIDFRFKNSLDYPIRIEATASGGSITVTIVGTDTRDYYVKMEYETLAVYDYETVYEEMTSDNEYGYRDGDYITSPYTGYFVKTYRCKYSKETNELISKDHEEDSEYNKRNAVICKIVDKEETPAQTDPLPGIGNGGVTDSGALPPE